MKNLLTKISFDIKISIAYFIGGCCWILFSDTILESLFDNGHLLTKLSIVKGFLFILVTSVLLFFLVKRYIKKSQSDANSIQQRNELLEKQNTEFQTLKNIAEESEIHFRLLVDNAPEAIFIQVDSKFAYLNKGAINLYGASSAEELIGTRIIDRIHPDFTELVIQRIKQLNEQKLPVTINEYKHIKVDNSVIDVSVSAVPFKFQGKNGALVFVKDITDRKRIEEKLQKSYDLLKNLSEQVPGVIYQYRLYPDGRSNFPYSSSGMWLIYEVTSDEVREDASPVFTRIHPDDYNYIVETIAESAKNQTEYHSEFRVILPKQGLRWRLCNAKPELLDDGSTLWHGIILDITDRKQAEELYKQKNEEINTFFDCALDLLCIADTHGKFIRLNKEWENVLNISTDELIGQNFIDLVHPDDKESTIKATQNLANQIEVTNFINRYRCEDGSYKWIEWKSYPLGNRIYAAARDITEQKSYQETLVQKNMELEASEEEIRAANEELISTYDALKESNYELEIAKEKAEIIGENFENIFFNSPVGIFVIDVDANGNYTINANNPTHEKIVGLKTELVKGKPLEILTEIAGIEVYNYVKELYDSILQTKQTISFEENIMVNNQKIVSKTTIRPLFDANGKVYRLIGTNLDISQLKITEQELVLAKEKAEESSRLKTAFLQNMSHEIRTPMNAIMGFSELILDNFNNRPKLENFSKIIIQRCDDLLVIIDDILDIAKIESGQLTVNIEKCNINLLLAELKNIFCEHQNRANKQHLNFVISTHNVSKLIIKTDKVKLKQIFINLIGNAFKFTDYGQIEFGYKIDNNNLVFYVSDTGIGIPREKQQIIFERFAQIEPSTNRLYGGNGLGLAIVKGLVGLLGGNIWLESEVNKGSTFYFSLPYKLEEDYEDVPTDIEDKDLSNSMLNKTILIVEDDTYNTAYINEVLSGRGLLLMNAQSGTEAVILATTQHFDLVLMDIGLPDMSGYIAIQQIRQQKPNLKIIAQTAYAAPSDRQKAIESGCVDYISKPLKPEPLIAIIKKYLI